MSAGPASERLARPEQAARLRKVDGALSRSVVFETLACREALSLALNLDVASDRKGVVDDINMAWAIYMVL